MLALPSLETRPESGSSTDARTRVPAEVGGRLSHPELHMLNPSPFWSWSFYEYTYRELSNQAATTTLPYDNPAYFQLIEAIERIANFSDLPDNWDSYGGSGPTSQARESAQELVLSLFTEGSLGTSKGLDILPVPTGGIQFEWSGPKGDIEIEIDPQGQFHWLIEYSDGRLQASSRDMPAQLDDIQHIVYRLAD